MDSAGDYGDGDDIIDATTSQCARTEVDMSAGMVMMILMILMMVI